MSIADEVAKPLMSELDPSATAFPPPSQQTTTLPKDTTDHPCFPQQPSPAAASAEAAAAAATRLKQALAENEATQQQLQPAQRLDAKQQICFDFTKGQCARGASCRFSHDVDLIIQVNSQEKGICFDFLKGLCARGALCRFSHDLRNLQAAPLAAPHSGMRRPFAPICYDFVKGQCTRGDDCRYSHDYASILLGPRPPGKNPNVMCVDFTRGRCSRGASCRYSHGEHLGTPQAYAQLAMAAAASVSASPFGGNGCDMQQQRLSDAGAPMFGECGGGMDAALAAVMLAAGSTTYSNPSVSSMPHLSWQQQHQQQQQQAALQTVLAQQQQQQQQQQNVPAPPQPHHQQQLSDPAYAALLAELQRIGLGSGVSQGSAAAAAGLATPDLGTPSLPLPTTEPSPASVLGPMPLSSLSHSQTPHQHPGLLHPARPLLMARHGNAAAATNSAASGTPAMHSQQNRPQLQQQQQHSKHQLQSIGGGVFTDTKISSAQPLDVAFQHPLLAKVKAATQGLSQSSSSSLLSASPPLTRGGCGGGGGAIREEGGPFGSGGTDSPTIRAAWGPTTNGAASLPIEVPPSSLQRRQDPTAAAAAAAAASGGALDGGRAGGAMMHPSAASAPGTSPVNVAATSPFASGLVGIGETPAGLDALRSIWADTR